MFPISLVAFLKCTFVTEILLESFPKKCVNNKQIKQQQLKIMDSNRLSLKRKTDYGEEENMFLDNNSALLINGGHKIMKRHQFDPLDASSSPNTHTVIELMPVQDPNKIHCNELNTHFNNNQNVQQQFIELANVAFDHGSFINVENILHQSHSSNIDPHNTAYAQTIWNGNDLILLQNCHSSALGTDPKLDQQYQIHDSVTSGMIMTNNIMSTNAVPVGQEVKGNQKF